MSVFAYLDAGTGSLIIQAIIGAILGVGVFLRTFWSRIVKLFKKNDSSDKDKKPAAETAAKSAKSSKSSE